MSLHVDLNDTNCTLTQGQWHVTARFLPKGDFKQVDESLSPEGLAQEGEVVLQVAVEEVDA